MTAALTLPQLLAQAHPLPSSPRVLALLHNELAATTPDLRKLCQLLSSDPALAGAVLQRVNAPARALAEPLGSVAQALALLQTDELRQLVQGASIGGARLGALALQDFWRYSLACARLTRSLAVALQLPQGLGYSAGLLHALGELVLLQAMPQDMAALDDQAPPLALQRAALEQRQLGYSYAEVSTALAQGWGLPAPLLDALAGQNNPLEGDQIEPLAGVLHLSIWRVRAHAAGHDERQLAVGFPDLVGLTLGLDIETVLQQTPFDWLEAQEQQEEERFLPLI